MLRPVYNAHCTMLYYTNKGHMHTPEFLTSWGASCVKMAFKSKTNSNGHHGRTPEGQKGRVKCVLRVHCVCVSLNDHRAVHAANRPNGARHTHTHSWGSTMSWPEIIACDGCVVGSIHPLQAMTSGQELSFPSFHSHLCLDPWLTPACSTGAIISFHTQHFHLTCRTYSHTCAYTHAVRTHTDTHA